MPAFFARMLKNIIGNGIPPNPTTNFQVLAQSGFTVQMRPGDIYLNGYFGYDNEASTFLITENLRSAPVYISCRYDAVAKDLYWVMSDTVERSETYYDLAMARIVIPSGAVEITDVMITDLRSDPAYCGYVQKITDTVAEELREEKLNKSDAMDAVCSPGQVIFRYDNINPATLYPGTTWQLISKGKMPIGYDPDDPDYNEVGKTGGSKTASYALGNSGYAKIDATATNPATLKYARKSVDSYATQFVMTGGQGATMTTEDSTTSRAVVLGGTTEEGSNMSPFIVLCMWLRIS